MDKPQEAQKTAYPSAEELVVATISKIENYGAFAQLDEYPGCEGMIHISEISSRWIKNIRDYVKDGQRLVLKVLRVDKEKGHIELSLKSVKPIQKKEVLDYYKKEQQARKLIELAAKKLKDEGKANEIIESLFAKFNSVYSPLENSLTLGEKAFEGTKISEDWKKALEKIAKENIEIPIVNIKANMDIECKAPNGIEVIKNALLKAKKEDLKKDMSLKIKYLGAPKYRIELTAPNYKIAEQTFDKITKGIKSDVEEGEGIIKISRL